MKAVQFKKHALVTTQLGTTGLRHEQTFFAFQSEPIRCGIPCQLVAEAQG